MYFTLHQTAMSPPFFTSERVQHQHPKWGEVDLSNLSPSVNTSATGKTLLIQENLLAWPFALFIELSSIMALHSPVL